MHDSYKKWLEAGCPKVYCSCGCGEEIIVKKHHKQRGIPEYTRGGHAFRIHPIPKSYQDWLDNNKPKIFCRCGCNEEIIVYPYHRWRGIPQYIKYHSSKGINHYFYGKHHPLGVRKKQSDSRKKYFENGG